MAKRIRHAFTRQDVVRGDKIALQCVQIAHVEAPVMKKMFDRARAASAAIRRPNRMLPMHGDAAAAPGPALTRAQRAINARHGFRFSQ
jgi:hypothetical protein